MDKVNIIIPAYNEENRIGSTLRAYSKYFNKVSKQNNFKYQILVVINGTTDNTEKIVKECKNIKYLNFKQGGKGFAITKGFEESLKDNFNLIGFVDADMATPPNAFYDLIKNINNYDGIIGNRWLKNSEVKRQKILRIILSRGFNLITRFLFLIPYTDTQCGAKLFKRKVIRKVTNELELTQWAFDVNLLYLCKKNNFKIKQFPTIWEEKVGSKIEVGRAPIQMFLGVVRLRLIYSIFEPILKQVKFILKIGDKLLNKNG